MIKDIPPQVTLRSARHDTCCAPVRSVPARCREARATGARLPPGQMVRHSDPRVRSWGRMSTSSPALPPCWSACPSCCCATQHRLGRRLEGARRIRKPEARAAVLAEIAAGDRTGAERRVAAAARRACPHHRTRKQLPVSQKKDEILEAIRDHQVVIVAGETGSGKTTQIPKICMELGRGVRGMIGHTQPRRIAARTVAERVAEELKTPLGEAVGWKVRFTDQVERTHTFVKLMTDGILLAEIQTDRELRQYDTIIIDEAHERSLNIDFLLGYLAQLLPKRPDLKVVITSATIDPERFARHFGGRRRSSRSAGGRIRSRSATGRSWRRTREDGDRDQITAICDAVDELQAEGPGDILVFLSGEREIRDTADALEQDRNGCDRHSRGPAALRPALARRAAPGLPAAHGPPDRAGDERRRDLADRPRHQVRHRPGHGPHLPLQPPHQGAAAADRADLAGQRQPAQGPLRPYVATASASGCTPRTTSSPGRSSPTPRSCGPTSPPSSSR